MIVFICLIIFSLGRTVNAEAVANLQIIRQMSGKYVGASRKTLKLLHQQTRGFFSADQWPPVLIIE